MSILDRASAVDRPSSMRGVPHGDTISAASVQASASAIRDWTNVVVARARVPKSTIATAACPEGHDEPCSRAGVELGVKVPVRRERPRGAVDNNRPRPAARAGWPRYISPTGKKSGQLVCVDAPSATIVEPQT